MAGVCRLCMDWYGGCVSGVYGLVWRACGGFVWIGMAGVCRVLQRSPNQRIGCSNIDLITIVCCTKDFMKEKKMKQKFEI